MVDKISGQVGVQAAGGNKMARRGENIHKRKDGRWEGRYIKARTPEGKIQWGYVYGTAYAEVKRVLIQKKAEAGFYNLKRTDLTFEALAEVWLRSLRNSIKESTYAHYSYTLHKYLLPVLSKVPVASLDESFLEQAMQQIIAPIDAAHKPLGNSSARECLSMLRRICKYAAHLRLIRPMELEVTLPKAIDQISAPLSPAEQQRLFQYVQENPTPRKIGLLLGLELGLRIGEICGLQWGDFDLKLGTLKINRTVCRISCGNTLIANIGLRKKVIMSERADPRAQFNNLPWKDKIGNFFMRKCGLYSLADWMVFQTHDAQSYYSEKIQRKSSIIPNPLDTAKLPERYAGEREKRIVAAGRFSEEKNFALLIDGFATFHESFPDYTLTIYGEGALRKDYEMQIQELGLGGSVKLPGFASNLPEEINKAAMYISTSNHEGISNSMLEALGMGIPTIVTDCPVGGSKMFVHTGENGVLIQMENKNELVSAMTLIATNSKYVKCISNNAIKIREQLAAPNICQRWLQLL